MKLSLGTASHVAGAAGGAMSGIGEAKSTNEAKGTEGNLKANRAAIDGRIDSTKEQLGLAKGHKAVQELVRDPNTHKFRPATEKELKQQLESLEQLKHQK
ncbi:MAG TPA: hypothetical protein VGZ01_13135 [Trinickia sp.]|nr:hypothetical protein [Trinickia sp.]